MDLLKRALARTVNWMWRAPAAAGHVGRLFLSGRLPLMRGNLGDGRAGPSEIQLRSEALHPAVAETLAAYSDGQTPKNGLRLADYQRWSIVLDMIEGGDLLDIGVGLGQFPDAAVRSGKFSRVRGADRSPHSSFRNLVGFEELRYDLTKDSGQLSAETVTCLECIEHIPDPSFDRAVANLKRIARKRLVVTVPFEERLPLPRYHHQRFDMDRLTTLFPGARIVVMRKGTGAAWACIDWRPG